MVRFSERLKRLFAAKRDEREIQRWIFSLIPLGVAFVFFFILMLPRDIPNKDVILLTGAGAGFAGLQTYWIVRGWRRAEGLTVLLGIVGILIVGAFVWAYDTFLGDILREIIKSSVY